MNAKTKKLDRLSALMSRFTTKVLIPNEIAKKPSCRNHITSTCLTLTSFRCLSKKFLSSESIDPKGVEEDDRFLIFSRFKGDSNPDSITDNSKVDTTNATVYLDGVDLIASALPSVIAINLKQEAELEAICKTLSEELLVHRCGFKVIVERLCEIVLVHLLRLALETGGTEAGMLAGLGHSNICIALIAIHENPGHKWTLEELAAISGMSRTGFANEFKRTVGETPARYLRIWRLQLARNDLNNGFPLKIVARNVGFSSQNSLSRAYIKHFGFSPGRLK